MLGSDKGNNKDTWQNKKVRAENKASTEAITKTQLVFQTKNRRKITEPIDGKEMETQSWKITQYMKFAMGNEMILLLL